MIISFWSKLVWLCQWVPLLTAYFLLIDFTLPWLDFDLFHSICITFPLFSVWPHFFLVIVWVATALTLMLLNLPSVTQDDAASRHRKTSVKWDTWEKCIKYICNATEEFNAARYAGNRQQATCLRFTLCDSVSTYRISIKHALASS